MTSPGSTDLARDMILKHLAHGAQVQQQLMVEMQKAGIKSWAFWEARRSLLYAGTIICYQAPGPGNHKMLTLAQQQREEVIPVAPNSNPDNTVSIRRRLINTDLDEFLKSFPDPSPELLAEWRKSCRARLSPWYGDVVIRDETNAVLKERGLYAPLRKVPAAGSNGLESKVAQLEERLAKLETALGI